MCCWPQRTEFGEGEKPCTLRPGKACSPTQVRKSSVLLEILICYSQEIKLSGS